MLRSRPNRQQRPSESSDERQGFGGQRGGSTNNNYHYGGYPKGSSAGPMSISSGADDDDGNDYNKKKKGGIGGPSKFGFNLSSPVGGGKHNKFSGGGSTTPRKSAAYNNYSSSSSSSSGYSGALILIAITISMLLSGTTFYYRKMTTRAKSELISLKAQARHPHEHHHDPVNNENNRAHAQAVSELKKKLSELQGELSRATVRNKDMENELVKTNKIYERLEEEMKAYDLQYDQMARSWNDMVLQVKETRQKFIDNHTKNRDDQTGGIVPGGPGHTLNQQRELEQMESMEDYEDFVQRREDALWDKIDLLIEKIGRDSQRETLEWFGADLLQHGVPEDDISFRVDLEVEYPKFDPYRPDENPELWSRVKGTISIEMAPLKLMPIAVNLFLQQVHHKLWEGCNFVINAMHILQAGPHQYKGQGQYSPNAFPLKNKFEKSRLDKMPYQEYSELYPHTKYTVGYAGRPGGPDFYINKVDNSENHGPGGQTHHDLHEEADPCFGRVVAGFEVMDEINRIPVDREKGSLLVAPVTIVSGKEMLPKQTK
eukprot:scaffold10180_cov179-Skeletonema_menzelii.AAC.1